MPHRGGPPRTSAANGGEQLRTAANGPGFSGSAGKPECRQNNCSRLQKTDRTTVHRFFSISLLVLLSACGMTEDDREEEKRHSYLTLADSAFEEALLAVCDLDGDGRISRYEAERMLSIDCSGRGIRSLYGIENFTALRTLDCSDNALTGLDLQRLGSLESVDCSHNELTSLQLGNLRGLTRLNCADNRLDLLPLEYTGSLSELDCSGNLLTTLDVSGCSRRMASVDATDNPPMTLFYRNRNQQIEQLRLDGGVRIEERE